MNNFSRANLVVIHALFFLSGTSGLIYQLIWVRQLGMVFGNTVHSAALVTAVFTLGLGLGGYVIGRWADRRHQRDLVRSLRVYGLSEIAVAALGLLLLAIIPQLMPLVAAWSSYVVDERGWSVLDIASHAVRYSAATLLLLPITFLMGGTLTLLIRATVGADVDNAGSRIGVLYAVNTAGAAAGCLLAGFLLIPHFGVSATVIVAAVLNLVAGVGALALRARDNVATAASVADAEAAIDDSDGVDRGASRRAVVLVCAALFSSGFAALALEIVWFRHLSSSLGKSRDVFSLLLAVLLTGIWAGSLLSGACLRRGLSPHRLFAATQAAFASSSLLLFYIAEPRALALALVSQGWSANVGNASPALVLVISAIIGLPSLLMGFSFPLANAITQRVLAETGTRAGALYLANTAGNVVGAIAAGFVLLPWLGIDMAVVVCGAASAVSILIVLQLARDAQHPLPDGAIVGSFAVASLALVLFSQLPDRWLAWRSFVALDRSQVIAMSEGANEALVVTEDAMGVRSLYTDGHPMSSTAWVPQRYMRLFAHWPLLQLPTAQRMLVICFGVGNTADAAALHPTLKRLDIADLSDGVLSHAGYFAATNHDVLQDARVHVHENDGRNHLSMMPPNTYDVVTLEPPPIAQAGVAALYSKEFYTLARSRLTDGGYLTQWLPAYQLSPEGVLAMVRAFVEVFPDSVLLEPAWKEFVLVGRAGGSVQLDVEQMTRAIAERPRVAADLDHLELFNAAEFAELFVADADTMRRATAGVAPLVDDLPSNEYAGANAENDLPALLFRSTDADLRAFCPRCFIGDGPAPGFEDLPATVALLRRMRAGADYLHTPRAPGRNAPWAGGYELAATPEEEALIARSGFLTATVATPERWRRRELLLQTPPPTVP